MNPSSNEAPVRAVLEEKIKAIHDKNPDAVLALYTDNPVTFDFKDPLQNKGKEAIKARLEEWFASYKGPVNQEMKELEVIAGDDLAFSHCLTRTYGTGTNGEQQDMWYRTTNGFKKVAAKWLITHEHVSDPVDMKTGKAMFDLKP